MTTEQLRHWLQRHPALHRLLGPAIAAKRILNGYAGRLDAYETFRPLLAEDPVLHVEAFGGRFALDPRSDVFRRLFLHGDYEPELARLCRRHLDPARDALDVGANVGFFSVLMARALDGGGGRVLAVEPTEGALRRLKRNLAMNGVAERVQIFEGLVLDRDGTASLKTVEGREEYSTVGAFDHPRVAREAFRTRETAAATLDRLVARHGLDPGFLKLDVEGAEHWALAGAEQVLTTHRPTILMELSDYLLRQNGSSAEALLGELTARRYRVVDALAPERPLRPGQYAQNVLCLPEEQDAAT